NRAMVLVRWLWKNKTHLASFWRVGFGSTYDFQFISSLFPPHRDGQAYSYPGNSKTKSPEAPSIRHGCTNRLRDSTEARARLQAESKAGGGAAQIRPLPALAATVR